MHHEYLMAIDAGTGSVRAVIFDAKGNQVAAVSEEWEHKEDPRYPGSMDFDWNHNWELTENCIRQAMAKSGIQAEELKGISTTCMREGIVLYDASGKEIWACANVDARSNDEVAFLISQNKALEKELYLKSGQTYSLSAIPRLLWVKNKMPEIYDKIASVGMFNDWLAYKLTGILATEPSNGSTTGLFDLQSRRWDPEIAAKCGIRTDIFPDVKESGFVLGRTDKKLVANTGLKAGIPVVVGGGDCQLGSLGVGVVNAGEAGVFGGSFWQYEYNTDHPRPDADCRVRVNCHAIPGLWQYEALAFQPGLVMRWYRDGFCQAEKELGAQTGRSAYDIMNERATFVPPGSYGMLCAFSDVMNFIQWKHAAPTFSNFMLNPEKYNKYTFYRAILENAALVTKGNVDLVYQTTGKLPPEITFASGAANSPLWSRILADVLGIPVNVPKVKEATALGGAILAGYGVGIYGDIAKAAKELVSIENRFEPDPENHALYGEIYEKWRAFYPAQLKLCDAGITKNMWIAPGL
ncbi:MAG: autoinducer-2 kinase [Fusobacteriaceae bacterium]|jgi:autoinducer 2 (AI-2) kinase|nr:autoinducer-2 kinase [Fusobacteriaceae bacterium]